MLTDRELAAAQEAGMHMRDAHKDRAPPLYAMGEDGFRLRRRWEAGWDRRDEEIRAERRTKQDTSQRPLVNRAKGRKR